MKFKFIISAYGLFSRKVVYNHKMCPLQILHRTLSNQTSNKTVFNYHVFILVGISVLFNHPQVLQNPYDFLPSLNKRSCRMLTGALYHIIKVNVELHKWQKMTKVVSSTSNLVRFVQLLNEILELQQLNFNTKLQKNKAHKSCCMYNFYGPFLAFLATCSFLGELFHWIES